MRRSKASLFAGLEGYLLALTEEVRELQAELKKLKARVDKVIPARRGRPPKALALLLAGGEEKPKRGRPPKTGQKRGRKPAKKLGRPKKTATKRGPGRPPKNEAAKRGRKPAKSRGPGRPPKTAAEKRSGRPPKNPAPVIALPLPEAPENQEP